MMHGLAEGLIGLLGLVEVIGPPLRPWNKDSRGVCPFSMDCSTWTGLCSTESTLALGRHSVLSIQ
jgi:hypothetical protein